MSEPTHHFLTAGGVHLHYVQAGEVNRDKGTIVFLHGFPEYWQTWAGQIDTLARDYRVIAPDLPGYNLSEKPAADSFFQVSNLITVMADFISKVNDSEPVYLVAHDWGGAIAWPLSAFYPNLIKKLVILNAAHPSTFTREMITNPKQRQKSEYIYQLIAEDGVEHLSKNDFAYLRAMVFEGMKNGRLSQRQKEGYLKAWQQPGAIEGMLRYYRSMPQLAAKAGSESDVPGPQVSVDKMKIPDIRIVVPTLVLWGEKDEAFVPELLDGLEDYVPDLQVKRFPGASHWLQHEYPADVSFSIADFIGR